MLCADLYIVWRGFLGLASPVRFLEVLRGLALLGDGSRKAAEFSLLPTTLRYRNRNILHGFLLLLDHAFIQPTLIYPATSEGVYAAGLFYEPGACVT